VAFGVGIGGRLLYKEDPKAVQEELKLFSLSLDSVVLDVEEVVEWMETFEDAVEETVGGGGMGEKNRKV
jgi:hypothetical protein